MLLGVDCNGRLMQGDESCLQAITQVVLEYPLRAPRQTRRQSLFIKADINSVSEYLSSDELSISS